MRVGAAAVRRRRRRRGPRGGGAARRRRRGTWRRRGGAGRRRGRGGGAAGRRGAAGGAAFGGAFGFSFCLPGGGLACAITSGAVCACDEGPANCIAVSAVVASSTRRRFVMMVWVPRKNFWQLTQSLSEKAVSVTAINKQALGRNVAAFKRRILFLFQRQARVLLPLFIAHSGDRFKLQVLHCPPSAVQARPDSDPAPNPANRRCRYRSRDRGRVRSIRSAHRQFIRRVPRQLFRPWRFAGILHRRRHLGPWTSRRAFLRRL